VLLFRTQLLRCINDELRMQQAEMGKGVFCFLCRRVAEQLGQIFVAESRGHVCKKKIFAVGHAFATEGGFEIGLGGGLG